MARNSRPITAAGSRAIDVFCRDRLGMPTALLMENAGRAVAEEALSMLKGKKRVVIVCGKGNNGGDGCAAARHLLCKKVKPRLFLCGSARDVRNEAALNLAIWLKLGQKVIGISGPGLKQLRQALKDCDLVIDALLGVGLNKKVEGLYKEAIGIINASGVPVLSVDIPSGLDADSGLALGCAVRAARTVTLVRPKRGMFLEDGLKICGKIVVRDLGVPPGKILSTPRA